MSGKQNQGKNEKTAHALSHCRNCGAEISGSYCSNCGQKYHEHKETFGELVYEFTSDFLHFDSKFFKTVLPLMFRPGKLTSDYIAGRRQSQFHPIRLYLFCSFIYFFLFFSFNKETREPQHSVETENSATIDSVASVTGAPTQRQKVDSGDK